MGTEWLSDIDEGLFHQVSYSFSYISLVETYQYLLASLAGKVYL